MVREAGVQFFSLPSPPPLSLHSPSFRVIQNHFCFIPRKTAFYFCMISILSFCGIYQLLRCCFYFFRSQLYKSHKIWLLWLGCQHQSWTERTRLYFSFSVLRPLLFSWENHVHVMCVYACGRNWKNLEIYLRNIARAQWLFYLCTAQSVHKPQNWFSIENWKIWTIYTKLYSYSIINHAICFVLTGSCTCMDGYTNSECYRIKWPNNSNFWIQPKWLFVLFPFLFQFYFQNLNRRMMCPMNLPTVQCWDEENVVLLLDFVLQFTLKHIDLKKKK